MDFIKNILNGKAGLHGMQFELITIIRYSVEVLVSKVLQTNEEWLRLAIQFFLNFRGRV